jgi:hypothetical protein
MKDWYEKMLDWMARRMMMAAAVRAVERTDELVDKYIDEHTPDSLKLKAPTLPEIEYHR